MQLLLEKGAGISLGDPDPVGVAAESVTEPVTQADASFGEPAKLIAIPTSEPVSKSDASFGELDKMTAEADCEPDNITSRKKI